MPVVYNFDSSQRAALQALVDAGQWFNAYSFVLQMISDQTPGVERPAAGVPMAEWLWVRGAQLVNSNSGPLANFIREYTKEQYEIRTGETLTDGRVQDASDEVARNFFNDVLGKRSDNPGVFGLRDIGTIGRADAAGAASEAHLDLARIRQLRSERLAAALGKPTLEDHAEINNSLAQLERYERRAFSRRKRALLALSKQ